MPLFPPKPSKPHPREYRSLLYPIHERTPFSREEIILDTYLIPTDPAYSLDERRVACIKLLKMGVQPPEWCFSREALGDAYPLIKNPPFAGSGAPPVSLLGKPASETQSAEPRGNREFDDLAGGRSRRRLRNRRPKKTMKKNRKRMTRKK